MQPSHIKFFKTEQEDAFNAHVEVKEKVTCCYTLFY